MVALFLGLWLSVSALAAPKLGTACYPSGLKIGLLQRSDTPIVGISTVVSGGSSNEAPDEEGAAHLVEHLWFLSTQQGARVDEVHSLLGAAANAYTSHDEIVYTTVAHRRAIRSLLMLEAERLMDPLMAITPSDVERERAVVFQEIQERFDGTDPSRTVLAAFVQEEHPYARSVPGRPEAVQALTLDTVRGYTRRTYAPGNTSLLIVGDVDRTLLLRLVEQEFPKRLLQAQPGGPASSFPCSTSDSAWPGAVPTSRASPAWPRKEARVDQSLVVFGWSLPAGEEYTPKAHTAAALIQWQLNDKTPVDARCSVQPSRRLSRLSCIAVAPSDSSAQAFVQNALKKVDRMWDQAADFSDEKYPFWRVQADYLAELAQRDHRDNQSYLGPDPSGFLATAALSFHRTGRIAPFKRSTAEQAAELAGEWLTSERLRGAVLVPRQGAAAGATYHGIRGKRVVEHADPGEVDAARLARVIVEPPLGDLQSTTLKNGMKIWVLATAQVDRNYLSVVFGGDAGWADRTLRDAAAYRLRDPYDALKKDQYWELFHEDIFLDHDTTDDHWIWFAEGPRPALSRTALALADSLPPPLKLIPRKEDRSLWKRTASERTSELEDPHTIAGRLLWEALADGLPHWYYDDEAFDTLRGISRRDARTFAKPYVVPTRGHVLVVTPAERVPKALDQTAYRFRSLRGDVEPSEAAPEVPTREAAPRRVAVIHDPDAGPQAHLDLACHIEYDDGIAVRLLQEALDEALNRALRTDMGTTYGVRVNAADLAHGTTLFVSTQIPAPATATAVQTVLASLDELGSGELEPAALARLQLSFARSTVTRWQTGPQILSLLIRAAHRDLPPEGLGYAERIAGIDIQDLAALLTTCTGKEILTVVGQSDAIGASLDAAEIAWTLED